MSMFREYQFQFNGFNFISSVNVESPMYKSIKQIPESVFIQMNLDSLKELLANIPMTREAIQERLIEINAGGSQAFISLGENN